MNQHLEKRINKMCRQDKAMALVFVGLVWLTVALVFAMVYSLVNNPLVLAVLGVSALVLLGFNTASITAMVRHYECDKHIIYELDIRHQDQNRAARQSVAH